MTLPGLGPKEKGFFAPNWSPGSGTFSIAGVPGPAKHAPVTVHVLPAGPLPTNAYLLTDPGRSSEAVLIDAPEDIWEPVQEILAREGCRLTALWITHGHWDHIQGAAEVVRRAQVPVLAHAADKTLLLDPQVMMRYSNDAGMTWSAERWASSGAIGGYLTRCKWDRCGKSRNRVWEFSGTDPVSWTLFGAEMQTTQGLA